MHRREVYGQVSTKLMWLVAVSASVLACGGRATPTGVPPAVPLPHALLLTCLRRSGPADYVFRMEDEWQGAHRDRGVSAPAVDFSRSMVAAHFDRASESAGCASFSVAAATLRGDVVVIEITRHGSRLPCFIGNTPYYPQILVELPSRAEAVRFEISDPLDFVFTKPACS